jgi:shikimate 5-dehydrogenase
MTAYIGNPTVHNLSPEPVHRAAHRPGALPHIYSAGTVDQWPKNLTCALMYGNPWMIPAPDFRAPTSA